MRLISYLQHILFSKRRHGTHSPFVYEYADKILYQFPIIQMPWTLKKTLRIQSNLLNATIAFLNPSNIDNRSQIIINNTESSNLNIKPNHLLQQLPIRIINSVADWTFDEKMPITIVLQPHHSANNTLHWNKMIQHSDYTLSLDLWYFGILINDATFKQKSHYRIK